MESYKQQGKRKGRKPVHFLPVVGLTVEMLKAEP
jgi:hypothetical protein